MLEVVVGLALVALTAAWRGATTRGRASAADRDPPADAASCWRPPGRVTTIYGHRLRDGMLFIGRGLRSVSGAAPEPALLDPSLPIAHGDVDWNGEGLGPRPSYTDMPAASRAAYLAWLAEGRRDPDVGVGYPRLFLQGLERRTLHAADAQQLPPTELEAIERELVELLAAYGGHLRFRQEAVALLRFLQAVAAPPSTDGPPPRVDGALGLDIAWRRGLCELSGRGRPLPADWALAWLRSRPVLHLAADACLCPVAFAALFRRRYAERHGSGLVITTHQQREELVHRTASPSFDGQVLRARITLPDGTTLRALTTTLRALARDCRRELSDYARWLDRHPGCAGSLAALAWLPPDLQRPLGGAALDALDRRLGLALDGGQRALVDVGDLLGRDALPGPAAMDTRAWEQLAALAARRGWGLTPDPRFDTGLTPTPTTVAVFRRADASDDVPPAGYGVAALTLQLGVEVAGADGRLDPAELAVLREQLDVQPAGRPADPARPHDRLEALLTWLLDHQPPADPAALERLTPTERRAAGSLLVRVAWADGRVVPAEIQAITRIYRQLGLDLRDVLKDLHARAGQVPVDDVAAWATRSPGRAGPGVTLCGDEVTFTRTSLPFAYLDPAPRASPGTARPAALQGDELTFLTAPLPFRALAAGRSPPSPGGRPVAARPGLQ